MPPYHCLSGRLHRRPCTGAIRYFQSAEYVREYRARQWAVLGYGSKPGANQQWLHQAVACATVADEHGPSQGCEKVAEPRRFCANALPIGSSPPNHRPLGHVTNNRTATFDPIWSLDRYSLDATWIYREIVVKWRAIEVTMDRAKEGEIGATAGERVVALARRCRSRRADKHSNS